MSKAELFIISAPSGAGKTSLVRALTGDLDKLRVSISHTTRSQRPSETNGVDYFFVARDEFNTMLESQAFLEHAQVFDNFYGTALRTVQEHLGNGNDVVLEIDWQGARQVRKMLPQAKSIFILPPSIEILEQRLRSRGQDSEVTIKRRMQDAVMEMRHYEEYDYLIVNDDFTLALTQIKALIIAFRMQTQRQQPALTKLLGRLLGTAIK